MSNARKHGDNGPEPISYAELQAWSSLTGALIKPQEIDILRQMDDAYISALNKEYADQRKREER